LHPKNGVRASEKPEGFVSPREWAEAAREG